MLGFIKKDLYMLKSNYKIIIAVIICLIFMMFNSEEYNSLSIMIFLPIIGILVFISTFSYDEFNNFNGYACSIKNGRFKIVLCKYITSIILSIFLLIISSILSFILGNSINDILYVFVETFLIISFIISILYPFMIKFGAMNGRIIIFVFVMIISSLSYLLRSYIDIDYIINFIDNLSILYMIPSSILLLSLSYFISYLVYKNKEF